MTSWSAWPRLGFFWLKLGTYWKIAACSRGPRLSHTAHTGKSRRPRGQSDHNYPSCGTGFVPDSSECCAEMIGRGQQVQHFSQFGLPLQKYYRLGGLNKQHLFLTVLEPVRQRSRQQQIGWRAVFWWKGQESSLGCLFHKGTDPIHEGSTLRTSSAPKGLIS